MKTFFKKIDKKELSVLLLLFLLSLPSAFAFFHAGFPKTDDGDWMIIRFSAFYEALRSGQFPVRWLSRLNNGFGYPVADFLYPGYMYLGVPLKAIGLSFVETIKVLFAVSLVASSFFTYLWLRNNFKRVASVAGALVYLYLPYHLADVTVRGSMGEVLALAVLPFVLWGVARRYFLVAVLGIGLLILAHNTVAILALPVIFGYAVIAGKKKNIHELVLTALLGVGTASFFWLPALTDLSATVFSRTVVANPFSYFATFAQIGIISFVLLIAGGVFLVVKKSLRKNHLYAYWLVVFVLSLFMSSFLSSVLWKVLPVQFVQFPFRFLSLTLIAGAVLTSYLIDELKLHSGVIIVFLIVLFATNNHFLPKEYALVPEGYYTTNQATTTVQNEYMPIAVKKTPSIQSESFMELKGGVVENVVKKGTTYTASVQVLSSQQLIVSQLYFPGWTGYSDGQRVAIAPQADTGNIALTLSKGSHNVLVRFEETNLRLFADLVSIGSVVAAVTLTFMRRRKHA